MPSYIGKSVAKWWVDDDLRFKQNRWERCLNGRHAAVDMDGMGSIATGIGTPAARS
jgi:hypothetical protein